MSGCHVPNTSEKEKNLKMCDCNCHADRWMVCNACICPKFKMDHFKELQETIEKLQKENEMRKDTIGCMDSAYSDALLELEKRINRLEIKQQSVSDPNRRPHTCPVCDGRGMKQNHLLTAMTCPINIDCGACEGKGVLWG